MGAVKHAKRNKMDVLTALCRSVRMLMSVVLAVNAQLSWFAWYLVHTNVCNTRHNMCRFTDATVQ